MKQDPPIVLAGQRGHCRLLQQIVRIGKEYTVALVGRARLALAVLMGKSAPSVDTHDGCRV